MLIPHIIEKDEISIDLVKKIHYELTKGTYDQYRYEINQERPGEFKKKDYITGKYEVGSFPENVEEDLSHLLEEVNHYQGDDVLTVASYLYASFENIHSCADGNGRVGRTLLNYYLLIHHIKPIIVYEEDRKLYYECLEAFDKNSDIESLKRFIAYEQEKTRTREKRKKEKSLKDLI